MPTYSFACACGIKTEHMRAMKDADKICMCECGLEMIRDFRADIPFASGGDYSRPIHSDSLAIAPSQRTEHLKLFPDIKLDSKNRPVFDKFGPHQDYLDKCNLVKDRKKVKSKGVRIA